MIVTEYQNWGHCITSKHLLYSAAAMRTMGLTLSPVQKWSASQSEESQSPLHSDRFFYLLTVTGSGMA